MPAVTSTNHAKVAEIATWLVDGDIDAQIIRIPNTGAANTGYQIGNPLGREPVAVLLVRKNCACDVIVKSADANKLVLQFTIDNADVNLMVW